MSHSNSQNLQQSNRKLEDMDEIIEKQLQKSRLEITFHMNYEKEKYIWKCIREGNKEKLEEYLIRININEIGLLAKKSQLRNKKNQAIIAIALATRAAIEGGLFPEIAYTMSDIYIQHVEETYDVERIIHYTHDYFFKLIERIQLIDANGQSTPVRVCKNYIYNHIFEKISIKKLAEMVALNPIYLSQLFKKETGLPLGKYIQQEKIKEAKKMLANPELSISDICMLLHFNDQSYFTSLFKRYLGMTPSQYRKKSQSTT